MPGPSYPNYTQLDADQVLQRSFDESADRLRVDASVTATIAGPFDVSIEADADNIAIRNSTNSNELLINADGSINTNITGDVTVELNAADGDNVAISDGTDTLAVNADGSINTISTYSASLVEQNYYGEASSVASGVETTVVTYTVPVGLSSYIHYVEASGTNIAQYTVYKNGSPIAKKWSIYTKLDVDYTFVSPTTKGAKFLAGDVITIKVLHSRPSLGDFSARLQVTEET